MKILTKYALKPYFYNVILRMIFWNMKYLFYNCQLLLLWCACCKFAIQASVQEDRHAIQIALAKRLLVLWMDLYPLVFHRVAKKLRHFVTITDKYTNGFAIITDVYTDTFTDGWRTFQNACLSEVTDEHNKTNAHVFWRTIFDGFRKTWRDFWNFWCKDQLNIDGI